MTLELGPPPRARLRIAIGAAVVLVIVGLAATVLAASLSPRGAVAEAPTGPRVTVETRAPPEEVLLVHILGAVERPGVYMLEPGARVLDALALAGGLSDDAEPAGINLARPLVDAEQILVPRVGEPLPPVGVGARVGAGAGALPGIRADGRVDLNAADRDALETLPGVGRATAERIIRWRESNGGFRAVEDLLAISGIGPRTLEALRDLVAV